VLYFVCFAFLGNWAANNWGRYLKEEETKSHQFEFKPRLDGETGAKTPCYKRPGIKTCGLGAPWGALPQAIA
jgi:hypothetical protein